MIRVAVLYPNSEGSTFDVEYYKQTHMQLVWQKLGHLGLLRCEVDAGVESGDGHRPPTRRSDTCFSNRSPGSSLRLPKEAMTLSRTYPTTPTSDPCCKPASTSKSPAPDNYPPRMR